MKSGRYPKSVGHALLDRRVHLGRQLARVERPPGADTDLREPRQEVFFRWIRRAVSQNEVQDIEKLRRSLLGIGSERLDEIDRRRGFGVVSE